MQYATVFPLVVHPPNGTTIELAGKQYSIFLPDTHLKNLNLGLLLRRGVLREGRTGGGGGRGGWGGTHDSACLIR